MKTVFQAIVLLFLGAGLTAQAQDVSLTSDGKVPGKPFEFLQQQINLLSNRLLAAESALASETSARIAADQALQTALAASRSPLHLVHLHIPFPAQVSASTEEPLLDVTGKFVVLGAAEMLALEVPTPSCLLRMRSVNSGTVVHLLLKHERLTQPDPRFPQVAAESDQTYTSPIADAPFGVLRVSSPGGLRRILHFEADLFVGNEPIDPPTTVAGTITNNPNGGCGFNIRVVAASTGMP